MLVCQQSEDCCYGGSPFCVKNMINKYVFTEKCICVLSGVERNAILG